MARKRTEIIAKISFEDKEFIKKVAFESDVSMSSIIVNGAMEKATQIKKELEKFNKDK